MRASFAAAILASGTVPAEEVSLKEATLAPLEARAEPMAAEALTFADGPGQTQEVVKSYLIKPGDTLWGIAEECLSDGRKWTEILDLNPTVDETDLAIGQRIKLPASAKGGEEINGYEICKGDTLWGISKKLTGDPLRNVEISALNPGIAEKDLRVGYLLKIPSASEAKKPQKDTELGETRRTIKSGDTLWDIAVERYGNGMNYREILAANPMLDLRRLQVGAEILLPQIVSGATKVEKPSKVEKVTGAPVPESAPAPSSVGGAGLDIIKRSEGLYLEAYVCPAGKLTIGYGHTSGVQAGQKITKEQADAFLKSDLSWAEKVVRTEVTVPLNQNQFDALVSFAFNVGPEKFKGSTLLRLLNQGDYASVPDQLNRWVKGGGRELPGLVTRRGAEGRLFGKE